MSERETVGLITTFPGTEAFAPRDFVIFRRGPHCWTVMSRPVGGGVFREHCGNFWDLPAAQAWVEDWISLAVEEEVAHTLALEISLAISGYGEVGLSPTSPTLSPSHHPQPKEPPHHA